MKAIEELLRLLDERGVEHEGGERSLRWRDRYGIMMQATPLANGELGMGVWSCTPEQAIAATLGPCNDSCSCTNGERMGERIDLDAATLGRRTWSDFDVKMAYHMGYDDALAGRKPDAGKVVTDG